KVTRYGEKKRRAMNLFLITALEDNWLTEWEEEAVAVYVISGKTPTAFIPEALPRLVLGRHALARIIERSKCDEWQALNSDDLFTVARKGVVTEVTSALHWCYFFFLLFGTGSTNPGQGIRFMLPTVNGALLISYVREQLVIHARTFIHDSQMSPRQRKVK